MLFPETIGGWLTAVGAFLTITVILTGFLIKLGNLQIDARIRSALGDAIVAAMQPIDVHLEAIRLQLVTQDGELARVRELEKTIENGLSHRQARIEGKVDRLLEHMAWDGDERRNDERDHG